MIRSPINPLKNHEIINNQCFQWNFHFRFRRKRLQAIYFIHQILFSILELGAWSGFQPDGVDILRKGWKKGWPPLVFSPLNVCLLHSLKIIFCAMALSVCYNFFLLSKSFWSYRDCRYRFERGARELLPPCIRLCLAWMKKRGQHVFLSPDKSEIYPFLIYRLAKNIFKSNRQKCRSFANAFQKCSTCLILFFEND